MAVTAENSGTLAATVGTSDEFVENTNVTGVFTFHVSLVNMVAGDAVILKVWQIIATGDSAELAYAHRYDGAQEVDVAISPAISNDLTDANSLRFSINQTHGSSRNFKWKVLKHPS